MRLQGRRIVITGAASGIGRAAAERFRREGASLTLFDRDSDGVRAVARSLGAQAVVADLLDENSVRSAMEQAADGMAGIDGIVHAAGVHAMADFAASELAHWQRMLDVNLTGTYLVCRHGLTWLQREPSATIVNVASGQAVLPSSGNAAYAASKAGVVALTKSMALELAPRIRANVVAPGAIATPMVTGATGTFKDLAPEQVGAVLSRYALGRLGQPQEIAEALLFLTSHESSYITGSLLGVDGGRVYH